MPMTKKKLKELRAARLAAVGEIETIVNTAAGESREFSLEEAEKRGRLTAQVEAIDDDIRAGEKEIKRTRKAEKAAQARMSLGIGFAQPGSVGGNFKVTEHRTYERNNGVSYLKDLSALTFGAGAMGDEYFRAFERLQRHAVENHYEALSLDAKDPSSRKAHEQYFLRQMFEAKNDRKSQRGPFGTRDGSHMRAGSYRALSTEAGAGGEFVPPMYLTAQFIEYLRAGRVIADNCHHEDLPDGTMVINIPKISGGTSVGSQPGENTNVSNTPAKTEYVTVPVVTKAGEQIVSLQLMERSPVSFDSAMMRDLAKAYAQQVDIAVALGAGGGDVTGILNTSGIHTVTWTQASPTIKGLYGQLGVIKADIAKTLFRPATHGFMVPTRWEWIGQSFDSNDRPLVVPEYSGPFNALQVAPDTATAEGPVGRNLSGLKTFEDANLPSDQGAGTNQDIVVVAAMDENWLYESPVVSRALPQTYGSQLSVLLQLYGYIAFTAARYPVANGVLTGTGLVAPTFNS